MQGNKKLIAYFAMAYFFSWLVFVPLALNKHGFIFLFPHDAEHARTIDFWHAFGGLGPLISAILTLLYFNGKNGLKIFLQEYSVKKITAVGWLFALSPFLLFAFAMIIAKFANGEWISLPGFFRENDLLKTSNFLMWFFPLLTYGFGEEGGWRGFALPQLQTKYSALLSTIILTVFWLGWHTPTFFYRYHFSPVMLVGFVLGLLAGAIWMTFLFNYTNGSLLAVSLWHFTFNLVSMIGTDQVVTATMSTAIMIAAVFIVVKYGGTNLSPFAKTAIQFGPIKIKVT